MSVKLEARWIDAWNDLLDLVGEARQMRCLLPDGTDVDVETCKGWLQDAVYAGDRVGVQRGWVKGKPGVHATREPFPKH
jgi:hypothetical protein